MNMKIPNWIFILGGAIILIVSIVTVVLFLRGAEYETLRNEKSNVKFNVHRETFQENVEKRNKALAFISAFSNEKKRKMDRDKELGPTPITKNENDVNKNRENRRLTTSSGDPLPLEQAEIIKRHHWEYAPGAFRLILESESQDSKWTERVLTEAAGLMSGRYKGTYIKNVDCRETLCEMELEHEDSESAFKFRRGRSYKEEPWYNNQFRNEIDNGNDRKTVVYFTKGKNMAAYRRLPETILSMVEE